MSLGDLLRDAPESVVVHDGDRVLGRDDLVASAANLAEALGRAGLAPGQVVAVCLPDTPAAIAALFGVWQAGGVHAPVSPRLTDAEISSHVADVDAATVVCSQADVDRMPTDRGVIVADGVVAWEQRRPTRVESVAQVDGVALVQRTSGTTGAPRPVPLFHDAVAELMDRVVGTLRPTTGSAPRVRAPQPNLIPVSLSLWAGIYNVLFALRVGAPIVLATPFDPVAFAGLVARHGVRSTVLPPAAMVMLADAAERGHIDGLAPLRFVRSITAPLHVAQARRFHDRFGITILNSYGQTELGGEVIGWSAADGKAHGATKVGALGRPHPGVEVRIDAGEICIRTPTMNVDADDVTMADRLTADGFLRTGDLGRIDDEGFVWIDGRVSDLIIRGGLKVFPAEVEEVLAGIDGVAEVAVAGVADGRLGEVPVAWLVASSGERPADAVLEAACRAELAPYKVPTRFVWVDALPRNEVGKIRRSDLSMTG